MMNNKSVNRNITEDRFFQFETPSLPLNRLDLHQLQAQKFQFMKFTMDEHGLSQNTSSMKQKITASVVPVRKWKIS